MAILIPLGPEPSYGEMGPLFGPPDRRLTFHDHGALYRMRGQIFAPLHAVGFACYWHRTDATSPQRWKTAPVTASSSPPPHGECQSARRGWWGLHPLI